MKVLFITNIISSHQIGLWDSFSKLDNIDFLYLYTEELPMEQKRYYEESRDYCIYSKHVNDVKTILYDADFVIVSKGCVKDDRIKTFLKQMNNIIYYSEHYSKEINTNSKYAICKYIIKGLLLRAKYHKKNKYNYALCASSHAGFDFFISGFKKKNIYKFGYFPSYDYNKKPLLNNKKILFVGRNIPLKHPEDSVFALDFLKEDNSSYSLDIVGKGFENYPSDGIEYYGELEHRCVIEKMMNSEIFIFSSDRREGWGVVLAEAMSSGCFVFANINAGCTNFLIRNGFNGYTYKNRKELEIRLKQFLKLSESKKQEIRKNAIKTIKNLWNSDIAASRLYNFLKSLYHKAIFYIKDDGPLSRDKCKF